MAKLSFPTLPFEKIAALSRTHRILICVGVFLILCGGFFYFVYMPKSSRLDELQKNYEDLEIRLIKARAAAKNLKKFQEQYKEAQVKFRLALQLLPDTKEIPSLLESISKAGQDSGLEFILFQPSAEVSRDFYAEIPVKIQVKGGYHSLAIFFDKVGKLPRIVNMFDIKITTPKTKGTQGYLDASCVAMTYRFLEASEMKASKAKKKKKKRG